MNRLKEVRDYLRTWLERHKKASEIAPDVQRTYDLVDWQYQLWTTAPDTFKTSCGETLEPVVDREYEVTIRHLPQLPAYNVHAVTTVSTVATSASSMSYDCLLTARELDAIVDPGFFERHAQAYQVIQARQNRFDEVRELTDRLFPDLAGQLESAWQAFDSARAGSVSTATAALEIRTLVDNAQGKLFGKARSHPTENMTWETMTARLCPSPVAVEQAATLTTQKGLRGQLIGRLSGIAKRRPEASVTDLEHAWIQALDHLTVVFRAIVEAGRLTSA